MGIEVVSTEVKNYDALDLVKKGTTTVTSVANTLNNTFTIPHGLGFLPIIVAYARVGSYYKLLPAVTSFTNDTGAGRVKMLGYISTEVTSTDINFYVSSVSGGDSYVIDYFLFRLRAIV